MNGILCLSITGILAATFYGLTKWEARQLKGNSQSIPESRLSLVAFLQHPWAIDVTLPPLVDHAARGHTQGLAPEAICFYAAWLYPEKPHQYVIWNENREVHYRCP